MKPVLISLIAAVLLWSSTGCRQEGYLTTAPGPSETTTASGSNQTTSPAATIPVTTSGSTMPPQTDSTQAQNTAGEIRSDAAAFYPSGVNVMIDLDGDEIDEEVFYEETDLLINGKSFGEIIGDRVFMNDPNPDHFVIADIDTLDPGKQIGILTSGPSDDHETFFYDYRNEELYDLGSVPALMENPETSFDGKGHIYGPKRLGVIQTWYAPARWKLESKILDDPYDLYHPITFGYEETIVLKEDLPIYTNMRDENPSSVMKPQEVEFLATDNKNWVQLEGADGTKGWFKFFEWSYLADLDKDVMDVFDNLNMSD